MTTRSPFLQHSREYLEQTRTRDTARLYVVWYRRFILYHQFQSAKEMRIEAQELVRAYLVHLACEQQATSATQNQALSALLVLYREMLGIKVSSARLWAKKPRRLPDILTRQEADALLEYVSGGMRLMIELLYGSGLKVGECCALRLPDVDCDNRTLHVRGRQTVLPLCAIPKLQRRMRFVADCYRSRGVSDPSRWYVFPGQELFDPDTEVCDDVHISVSRLQKAVSQAARKAQRDEAILSPVSCQGLRDSFAVTLLRSGHDVRTVQDLLGIRHIKNMAKYLAFVPLCRERSDD